MCSLKRDNRGHFAVEIAAPSTRRVLKTRSLEAPLGQIGVVTLAGDNEWREQGNSLSLVYRVAGAQQWRLRFAARWRRYSRGSIAFPTLRTADAGSGRFSVSVATVLLRPPRLVRCSMATVGGIPKMASTSRGQPVAQTAGHSVRDSIQIPALSLVNRMSNASVDLPEPDTPVMTVNLSRGISTSMLLRLCSTSVVNHDGVAIAAISIARVRFGDAREGGARDRIAQGCSGRQVFSQSLFVGGQRLSRVRTIVSRDFRGRAGTDDFAAAVATFGAEIDDPVRGADDVEIVLDHQQGVSGSQQFAEGAQQLGDILEVQAGRRLVEQKQLAAMGGAGHDRGPPRRDGRPASVAGLTAGQCGYRLSQLDVFESNICQRCEAVPRLSRESAKKANPPSRSCREHRRCSRAKPLAPLALDVQYLIAVAATIAIGGNAGTRPTETASRRARSRCLSRVGQRPLPELKLKVPAVYLRSCAAGSVAKIARISVKGLRHNSRDWSEWSARSRSGRP